MVVLVVAIVRSATPSRRPCTAIPRGCAATCGWGAVGALVLIALCLVHSVVIFPTEVVNAAAGYVYGFWLGLAIVMVGWTASSIVAYAIGRHLGRPALRRLAGTSASSASRRRRARRRDRPARGAPDPAAPYSGIGYVAGASCGQLWVRLHQAVNRLSIRSFPIRPRLGEAKTVGIFQPMAERAVEADMGQPDHGDRDW